MSRARRLDSQSAGEVANANADSLIELRRLDDTADAIRRRHPGRINARRRGEDPPGHRHRHLRLYFCGSLLVVGALVLVTCGATTRTTPNHARRSARACASTGTMSA
jgi:hypothetical protein